MRYAEVALNVPLRKTFTYHIPDELDAAVAPGCLARVRIRRGHAAGYCTRAA